MKQCGFRIVAKGCLQKTLNLFGLPQQVTFVNYVEVFDRFNFWRALFNSFVTTAGGVVLCVILALVLAYAVTKMRLPFRNFIFVFLIGTLVLPVQTILFPLYQTLITLRFVGRYWGLMIAFATFGLPLTVYLLAAYFKGIPNELLDAAHVDGATHGQIVARVMIPLAIGIPIGAVFMGVLIGLLAWGAGAIFGKKVPEQIEGSGM